MVPDLTVLSSLRSLFDQVDFKRFRAFLEALERDEIHRAVHATEHPDVARGRAQMIVWLRQQIEGCKDVAAAMERRADVKPTPSRRQGSVQARR
jgi:hypothetical protein